MVCLESYEKTNCRSMDACNQQGECPRNVGGVPGHVLQCQRREGCGARGQVPWFSLCRARQRAFRHVQQEKGVSTPLFCQALHGQRGVFTTRYQGASFQPRGLCCDVVQCDYKKASGEVAGPRARATSKGWSRRCFKGEERAKTSRSREQGTQRKGTKEEASSSKGKTSWGCPRFRGGRFEREAEWFEGSYPRKGASRASPLRGRAEVGEHRNPLIRGRGIVTCAGRSPPDWNGSEEGSLGSDGEEEETKGGKEEEEEKEEVRGGFHIGGYKREYFKELTRAAGVKRRGGPKGIKRRTEEEEETELSRKSRRGSGQGVGTFRTWKSQEREESFVFEEEEEKEEEEWRRPIEQWGDELLGGELFKRLGGRGGIREQQRDGGPNGKKKQGEARIGPGTFGTACSSPTGPEFCGESPIRDYSSGSRSQDPKLFPSYSEATTGSHLGPGTGDVPYCHGPRSAQEGPLEPGGGLLGGTVLCSPPKSDRWALASGKTLGDTFPRRGHVDYHSGAVTNEATRPHRCQSARIGVSKWKLGFWMESQRKRRKRQMARWRMERRAAERRKRKGERKERKGRLTSEGSLREGWGLESEGTSWREVEEDPGLAAECRALYEKFESRDVFSWKTGRKLSWGMMVSTVSTLSQLGCMLSWMVCQLVFNPAGRMLEDEIVVSLLGKMAAKTLPHRYRKKGEVFPLRVGKLARFCGILLRVHVEEVISEEFVKTFAMHGWVLSILAGCNLLSESGAVLVTGPWNRGEERLVRSVFMNAKKSLARDVVNVADPLTMDRELAAKRVGYNGEEIAACHPLSVEQCFPALPPEGHGGSIWALDWLGPSSRDLLLHPERCLLASPDLSKVRVPGRVHVKSGEKLEIAKELVRRNVCQWVPLSQVVEVGGVKILNGLFGVEKPSTTESGKPILRLIMNLVPSNSILKQLPGKVRSLPSINSWQSTFMDQGEELRLFQSDMSSAFYLFRIPMSWLSYLAFNVIVDGKAVGKDCGRDYALACSVLPMGWASSVGLMQEISENILLHGGMEQSQQIRRGRALPPWMCDTLGQAKMSGRVWWHVYLDNFCACEKLFPSSPAVQGDLCHQLAEELWQKAGVVSSEKKKRRVAESIEELGAEVDGKVGRLGGSALRKLKVAQFTIHLLSKPFLNRKHVQILAGRWVFLMQFRRPSMSIFNAVWSFVGEKLKDKKQTISEVRQELTMAVRLLPLMSTDLRAPAASMIGASDASSTGGAVSMGRTLTEEGKDFVGASQSAQADSPSSPILVISLFNGIGGCFRCYDVIGVRPRGRISFDLCREANRIVERRWPGTIMMGDVKDITLEMVEEWAVQFGDVEEVHLWGGFPCVDLSSAKAFRRNLEGPQSSLFWEIPRIKGLILAVFEGRAKVKHLFENVASMDMSAAQTISDTLQCVPYKVDCVQAVPMRRPRFAWCSEPIEGMLPDVATESKSYWQDVYAEAPYPQVGCWLTPGTRWMGESEGACFPTCMKAIVRSRPPPRPAGIEKCDPDTLERWRVDDYRYPPYQYKFPYLIMGERGWRLLSANERELLLGYGFKHTSLCLSASAIKANKTWYEDLRCSLLGDSFSVYSFVIFAYVLSYRYVTRMNYLHLASRMGLAPGFMAPARFVSPLCRGLSYGSSMEFRNHFAVRHLNELLLRNTDHTRSDVRIVSGETLGKKIFPRQSVSAQWWVWEPVFKTRWKHKSHINLLELEAILLGVKYQLMRLGLSSHRIFHISDSYVCISIISKGRSSSRLLQRRLKYLAALLLAANAQLVLAHVESTENPTDEASRA